MSVARQVQEWMNGRLPPDARLLVAVSGGADSTALLLALHQASATQSWSIGVAHLDHGLRPEASKEKKSVARLAERLGLPFFTGTADVKVLMKNKNLSLEMAAREARYTFLKEQAMAWKAHAVALGHTQNDQAETVLLRLMRGSGLAGLSAMADDTQRDGIRWLRPLLGLLRSDLETWLIEQHIDWCEDTSNDDPTMLRNRVRHELLPLLTERFNPGITGTLSRNASLLADEDALLAQLSDMAQQEVTNPLGINTHRLHQQPPALARRIILNLLLELDLNPEAVNSAMVQRVLNLSARRDGSSSCVLAEGWKAVRTYDLLRFERNSRRPPQVKFCQNLVLPGFTTIPESSFSIEVKSGKGPLRPKPGEAPCAALPRSQLKEATLRNRTPGLRIRLAGLNGSRKVQDLLVEAKIPRNERDTYPLLFSENKLIWVPGFRPAEHWCVNDSEEDAWHIYIHTP